MRTRATLKVLVWTVALLASANNLAGWGGVALTPGIGYAAQELEGLVVEPTDQLLDAVVTEAGVFSTTTA